MFKPSSSLLLAGLMAMLFSASSAIAAVPSLSLAFKDSAVTVNPNENVDIWVTLTVSDAPLVIDLSSPQTYPFGLDPSLLPGTGNNYTVPASNVPFAHYDNVNLFTSRSCVDDVTDSLCNPLIYTYTTWSTPGNWLELPNNSPDNKITLSQGTHDFIVNTLMPVGGYATPGSYNIFNVGLGLFVNGRAADGTELTADVFALTTCPNGGDCAFTINVVPVPEPETMAMLLAGLGIISLIRRKQRS
jgi:hypothetical protein